MATKTKNWTTGSGSATIQYGGQGDGEIIITSDPNSVYEARSMQITVETTDGSGISRTVTIQQAAKQRIDISAAVVTAATQTYDGGAKTPTPTVTLNGAAVPSTGYDVAYSNNTNAGTATITVTGKGDYTGTATGTFTINKAAGVAGVSGRSLTYSRNAQNLVTVNGNTGTVHYRLGTSGSWSTSIPTSTNAGTYTIYYYVDASNNYNAVGSSSNPYDVSTTMAKRTPVLSVSPSLVTGLTYTGSAQNLLSGGEMQHSGSNSTVVTGTFTYDQGSNAGDYSNPYWYFTPNDTTNYESRSGYISGSVNIAKANPTYTAPVAESLTYIGSSQFLITTGSTNHGTIQYSANGTSWSNTRPSGTNAGSYTAYWRLVGDSNHNDVASTQISNVGIAQKALTITAKAQSVTYGTAITQGTGQITTSGLISGHSVTAITLAQSTTNVTTTGTITPSAATVKQSSTDVTANYNITYNTGTLTITAATPSYTAPTAKTSLTYSRGSQSLVNAGTASGGTMYYYATTTNSKPSSTSSFSSSIPTKTSAGTYYVWYYVKGDSNHTDTAISSTSVSVTISKATPVISTAPSKRTGLAYTGSVQNLLSGGSVKHSSSDSTSVSGTFTYAQGTNAGTYSSLTWSFTPSSSNYNSISGTVSGSVEIAKASRTISFTKAPTPIGIGDNGILAASVSAGSGDGTISFSSSNTSKATISGDRVTGVAAGTATITASVSAGTNYKAATATYTVTVSALDYIDMGLPSGLLWAKCNIDVLQSSGFAASPYQYPASFFSWGNIDGHNLNSNNDFSPYSFGNSNTGAPYASSAGAALTGNIPLANDAARQILGGTWKMPTKANFDELLNTNYTKCIDASGNTITTTDRRTTVNGVQGLYIESKINGNRIFLPCCGLAGVNSSIWNRTVYGYYWMSDLLNDGEGRAIIISNTVYTGASYYRYQGLPIRAVK